MWLRYVITNQKEKTPQKIRYSNFTPEVTSNNIKDIHNGSSKRCFLDPN